MEKRDAHYVQLRIYGKKGEEQTSQPNEKEKGNRSSEPMKKLHVTF